MPVLIETFFLLYASSLEPIRLYKGEDIVIQLPGDMTVFNVDWLSVFDVKSKSNYGSVIIPDGLNVPPSLVKVTYSFNSLSYPLLDAIVALNDRSKYR